MIGRTRTASARTSVRASTRPRGSTNREIPVSAAPSTAEQDLHGGHVEREAAERAPALPEEDEHGDQGDEERVAREGLRPEREADEEARHRGCRIADHPRECTAGVTPGFVDRAGSGNRFSPNRRHRTR